jgi:hypothetical protein
MRTFMLLVVVAVEWNSCPPFRSRISWFLSGFEHRIESSLSQKGTANVDPFTLHRILSHYLRRVQRS